jgi:hypothetical protein
MPHEEIIDPLAGLIGGHGAHGQGTFRPSRLQQFGGRAVHSFA